ncbi:methyl-accepting chemotaxis protein [Paenibacillus sp. P26]|nr:methyl-accepting chemotaxis protein [Paenibacillus sp. P26]UUZ96619.1 methyl-accepting chemotaxis protein [Paenibacillus sp. P25]
MSIVKKIVIGLIAVSVTTYGCSAFFIFVLKDVLAPGMPAGLYIACILLLGVLWTAILGWLGALWLTKPLLRLTTVTQEAAKGNLQIEVPVHPANDEIRGLGSSFQQMIDKLRQMVLDLSDSASYTRHHAAVLNENIAGAAEQIERIAHAADWIAQGAAEQAASSQGSLSAALQMYDMVRDISKQADQSQTIAEEMTGTIEQGEPS